VVFQHKEEQRQTRFHEEEKPELQQICIKGLQTNAASKASAKAMRKMYEGPIQSIYT